MNNKKAGNKLEREFAEMLSADGHWVYVMPTGQGQPADIVAGKDGKISLYDCKDCTGSGFVLSRIEENQSTAAELFAACGCDAYYFAIKYDGKIYVAPWQMLHDSGQMGYKNLKEPLLEYMSVGVYECK